MRVTRLSLRNFRSYEAEEVRLGPGLTVITENGWQAVSSTPGRISRM